MDSLMASLCSSSSIFPLNPSSSDHSNRVTINLNIKQYSMKFAHLSSPANLTKKVCFNHEMKISTKVCASKRPDQASDHQYCYNGRLVDESMIILRRRIHEMKMAERNYEPPSDWMDWEKSYYTCYDSIICDLMGVLQSQLMNTRPSFALGIIALILLSLPTSTAMVLFHFVEMSKGILSGI